MTCESKIGLCAGSLEPFTLAQQLYNPYHFKGAICIWAISNTAFQAMPLNMDRPWEAMLHLKLNINLIRESPGIYETNIGQSPSKKLTTVESIPL